MEREFQPLFLFRFRTGFVQVPDLRCGWINHPSEAVEVGQRITAEVIIAETCRDPFRSGRTLTEGSAGRSAHSVCGSGRPGPHRTGHKDRSLCVFVQLAAGVVGLLRLSELTDEPVETPDQLVDEGELITLEVAEVDLQRHRVRLGATGGAGRNQQMGTLVPDSIVAPRRLTAPGWPEEARPLGANKRVPPTRNHQVTEPRWVQLTCPGSSGRFSGPWRLSSRSAW